MKLLTKVRNYLQDLSIYTGKGRAETEDLDVMSFNRPTKPTNTVYTDRYATFVDEQKERMEAMRRHPSAQNGKRGK